MRVETGQVVIILLLVMVVSLAVGLSVVGRTVTEVSTASKTEDSTRAFTAAEAGLEVALKQTQPLAGTPVPTVAINSLTNRAQSNVDTIRLPKSNPPTALEYPPIGKEAFAQFWLSSPNDANSDGYPDSSYSSNSFDIYFGRPDVDGNYYQDNPSDKPAIEVHVIRRNVSTYEDKKYFFDSYSGVGASSARNNLFSGCGLLNDSTVTNNGTQPTNFYCKVTVSDPAFTVAADKYIVMARVRILYSNLTHPIAVKPTTGSLPTQTSIYRSVGLAGTSQRTLEVFQQDMVMPQFFDYVLFSAGEISKVTR